MGQKWRYWLSTAPAGTTGDSFKLSKKIYFIFYNCKIYYWLKSSILPSEAPPPLPPPYLFPSISWSVPHQLLKLCTEQTWQGKAIHHLLPPFPHGHQHRHLNHSFLQLWLDVSREFLSSKKPEKWKSGLIWLGFTSCVFHLIFSVRKWRTDILWELPPTEDQHHHGAVTLAGSD